MEQLYLWGPWVIVAVYVGVLVYRGRSGLRPLALGFEALVVVVAYGVYYVVRGSTAGDEATAIDHAEVIIDIERALGFYWEEAWQDAVLGHEWLTLLGNWIYIWWHWPIIIVVAVWLYLNKPASYRAYRDAFVLSGAIGVVLFAILPVAPPRIADPDIVDTIALRSAAYRDYEAPAFVNLYAAFPSLHFGWNLLLSIAIVFETRTPAVRAIGIISPVAVLWSIVVTGNHFFIDAAAGAVIAVGSLLVVRRYPLFPVLSAAAPSRVRLWPRGYAWSRRKQ